MDKYEYNLKLDQMKSLCAEGSYAEAAEIADTVNWNKIKNVNALVKAGEIYEQMGRYQEAREILLMAYDRSPIGRTILYRLAEVAIKMGDFSAAKEYYDEFVEIAPHDNLKYTLQYDMKKAQGADPTELIPILEELNEIEYTEEWAFELASLYHKAGMSDKCVEACDELILWFGEGSYVERALELKMLYQPLSKSQEDKYRRFHKGRQAAYAEQSVEDDIRENAIMPRVKESESKFNTLNLQEEIAKGMQQIISATEQGAVSDTMDNIKKMVEEIPYLQLQLDDTQKLVVQQKRDTDAVIDGTIRTDFEEMLGSGNQDNDSAPQQDGIEEDKSIAGALDEWEKTRRAAEAALMAADQRKLESAKAAALQEAEGLMDKLNDVKPLLDAGVSPKTLLEEEYMQRESDDADDNDDMEPVVFEDEPEIHPVLLGNLSADEAENPDDEPQQSVDEVSDGNEEENVPAEPEETIEIKDDALADAAEDEIDAEVEAMLARVSSEAQESHSSPEDLFTEDMDMVPDIEGADDMNEETEVYEDEADGQDEAELHDDDDEPSDVGGSGNAMEEFADIRSVEDLQRALNVLEENVENKTQKMPSLEELMAAINGSPDQGRSLESAGEKEQPAEQAAGSKFFSRRKKEPPITRMQDIFAQEEAKAEEEMDHEHLTDSQKAVFSYFVPVTGMENQLSHALGNISEHLLSDDTAYR
ncbi:MAG: tetratricopeptide repeat protein, partial [Clostridiales bacterium]|nr:tetratricopeptide repeat protein [Clostridiales bacterium]